MRNQLKQILFLAIFGFLSTAFVFFVPCGSSPAESESGTSSKQTEQDQNTDSFSGAQEPHLTGSFTLVFGAPFSAELFSGMKTELFNKRGIDLVLQELPSDFSEGRISGDLLLMPYDLLSGAQLNAIGFQEDIRSLFIPQIQKFVGEHSDFLPFGLDPAVMIGLTGLQTGLDGMYAAFQNWKPKSALASFSFGLYDPSSFGVLPFHHTSNLLFAQQLEDFIRFNDVGAFQQRIEMNSLLLSQQKRLYELIFMSHYHKFPLLKGILELDFGFYSQFGGLLSQDARIGVQRYPYQYAGLPSRLYGFALPSSGQHRELVNQFLLDYMDIAFAKGGVSVASKAKMIPVFQNEFEGICGAGACDVPDEVRIIENGPAKIDRFLKDRLLQKTIEKKIKPDLYLREASV